MGRRGRPRGPYRVGEDEEEDAGRLTPQAQQVRRQLADLEADQRVRAAGLIAAEFGLDPVAVLAERDVLKRLLRLAAFNIVQTENAKAQRRAAKQH